MFKAQAGRRGGDLGAGPLGGRQGARRRGARAGVDDGGDQHHRRHARARGRTSSTRRPRRVRDFVHGWFDGIEMIKNDPAAAYAVVGQGAEARHRHRLGHALGPEAHAVRRQRAVLRPDRRQGALRDAVRHRVRHLAQEGPGDPRRSTRKDWADTRFVAVARRRLPGPEGEEPKLAAKAPSANDRAIINKQIQIHFTPGSDEIMPGSYFVLDSLGETMTSFGNTYLRVEGNTDSTGSPTANMTLSRAPRAGGEELLLKNFPSIQADALPDDRPRRRQSGRAEHDRGRTAVEPPHRHQGRARHARVDRVEE